MLSSATTSPRGLWETRVWHYFFGSSEASPRHVTEIIFGTFITGCLIFFIRPLRKYAVKLLDNAMTGAIDEHIAGYFGITAPGVIDFAWTWCVPPALVFGSFWIYHLLKSDAWNQKEGRQTLLGLALTIAGSLALLAGVGLLVRTSETPQTTAERQQRAASDSAPSSKVDADSEVVRRLERVEKDLLSKGSDLAATRQELEATKRQLASALNPAQSPPPPPDRNISELTGNEKKALVLALNAEVRPITKQVFISRSTVAPYSHDIGTMSNIFEGAGIQAATGVQSPDGPSQTGLMIGLTDMNSPPPAAQKIKDLFSKYGISSTYYLLNANTPNIEGFNIFIGSKAW